MTAHGTQVKLVRPLRSGQVTIPVEFRRALGFSEETLLEMSLGKNGEITMRPVEREMAYAVDPASLRALYESFAEVREEAIAKNMTEEEIDEAIGEAVAAVRAERRQSRDTNREERTAHDAPAQT